MKATLPTMPNTSRMMFSIETAQPLKQLVQKYQPDTPKEDMYFMKEFILWGLAENNKLSKTALAKATILRIFMGAISVSCRFY